MQLTFLRPLLDSAGPFASVYLDTSATDRGPTDVQALQVRWREQRAELEKELADPATLDALGEVLTGPQALGAPGMAAFGRDGTVPLAVRLPDVPRREQARWSQLPDLLPLLVQAPPRPPYLLVGATRAGGEVLVVGGAGENTREEVQGTGWPVHKTKVGGWSQDRYQRSAEEAWETNAKELADAVTHATGGQPAEAVIVAGDVRARELLVEKLPDDLQRKVIMVDRELPVDSEELTQAAEQALQQLEDDDCRRRLDTWRSQAGTGRAVEGLAETVATLRDGEVAELFLGGDYRSRDRDVPGPRWAGTEAYVGPGLADIGLTEDELRERLVDRIVPDLIDAALVRAAAGTDAELFVVPPDQPSLRDDIGALLRFAVPGA